MLLGHHGVPSLSVERHAGTAIHPRAGHFQLARWRCCARSGWRTRRARRRCATYHPTGGIISVESLAGRSSPPTSRSSTRASRASARRVRVFINQDALEPILRESALELGATVRNRIEVVGARAGRRGRDRDPSRPRRRRRAQRSRALRRRRRRQPQPDPRAARHPDGGLRRALAQHHDLLPRRLRAAAAGPQPGRHLRPQRVAARLLPPRPHRRDRLPGRSTPSARTSRTDEAVNVSEGLTDERVQELLALAIGAGRADRGPRRRALARRVQLRGALARGTRLPRRRRGARRPAQRRLRRQRRHPGRPQPRVEARRRRQGRGRAGAAGHLRRRARPAGAA